MINEEWKSIEGFDFYQVSNLGNVRSITRRVKMGTGYGTKQGTILRQQKCTGYCQVILTLHRKQYIFLVHRLVAKAFVDNPHMKSIVHHKDHNTFNNSASNLEWVNVGENVHMSKIKVRQKVCDQGFIIVGEEWKNIDNTYRISNYGRIQNIQTGKTYKDWNDKKYPKVCINGKWYGIHRLVAQYFIHNSDINKTEVNHKDGDPRNNYYKNLEWCTRSENTLHSIHTLKAKIRRGSRHTFSKLTEQDVRNIRNESTCSLVELGKKYNVDPTNIRSILHRKTWKHI